MPYRWPTTPSSLACLYRDDVRAKLRTMTKRLLAKHGYPPDAQPTAIQLFLRHMETFEGRLILHWLVTIWGRDSPVLPTVQRRLPSALSFRPRSDGEHRKAWHPPGSFNA
ncbi:type I restriction enzyme endonuclease domain-containing protein [Streptosporangium sp. NPDC049046]|uniref:type I restriction enzyme endonuclease domain-containing protein n=1 Tax=Streptosporangium sp. NPDC049046 TaxID=3155031 RepID=UPI003437409D